jgi:FkbM family methyltransferase
VFQIARLDGVFRLTQSLWKKNNESRMNSQTVDFREFATLKRRWVIGFLLQVRPQVLASMLKRLLGIRREVVRVHGGFRLWLDPVSNPARFFLFGKPYEPEVSGLIEGLLQPGDVFVDVGANEGVFSVLAGLRVGEGGRVIAVEPQQRLHRVLLRNRSLNGLGSVMTILAMGLGAELGESTLELASDLNTGASGRRRVWSIGAGRQKMRVAPLDKVVRKLGLETIRLIKVDCEGGEVEVIAGARRTLSAGKVGALLVEYHPHVIGERACQELDETIRGFGFGARSIGEHHVLYEREGVLRP